MKKLTFAFLPTIFALLLSQPVSADNFLDKTITISHNERFKFVEGNSLNFKFQPLSEAARSLEITDQASSLGVTYLGKIKLIDDHTTLSALRSIGDQIGNSLDIHFGVIADSNTSSALQTNELLLLYHPMATLTLALVKTEEEIYELICTYTLKQADQKTTAENNDTGESSEIAEVTEKGKHQKE